MDESPSFPVFSDFAADVCQRVEARLGQLFERHRTHLAGLDEHLPPLGDAVFDLTLRGGKRLRAVLVASGLVAASPEADLAPAVRAGAAIELLQTYFLIHDDWMDGDTLRRGGPTAHVALAEQLGDARVGEWAAILAGDYAIALAQTELASAASAPAVALSILQQFADIQRDTVCGQFLDVTGAAEYVSDYRLEELKTSTYSVRGPLVMGATLGGASQQLLEACNGYGSALGVAFQLRDDLLGLFGDPRTTGKPRGNDLIAGKMSSVIRDALRAANPSERGALRAVLDRLDSGPDALQRALDAVSSSGAVRRSEARIAELSSQAARNLRAEAGFSARGLTYLSQLATRLTDRTA